MPVLQALCQQFNGNTLAVYLRRLGKYLLENPDGDAAAFFLLTIDSFHPKSASKLFSIEGLIFMPGTSADAQRLPRMLRKSALWRVMQQTDVKQLYKCMAVLASCCDAERYWQ